MEHVQVKAHVMEQQELVCASKVLKGHLIDAKVIVGLVYVGKRSGVSKVFCSFTDLSCPGLGSPCSGNGQCDLTIGVCTCHEGFQGLDCFRKFFHEI